MRVVGCRSHRRRRRPGSCGAPTGPTTAAGTDGGVLQHREEARQTGQDSVRSRAPFQARGRWRERALGSAGVRLARRPDGPGERAQEADRRRRRLLARQAQEPERQAGAEDRPDRRGGHRPGRHSLGRRGRARVPRVRHLRRAAVHQVRFRRQGRGVRVRIAHGRHERVRHGRVQQVRGQEVMT